MFWKRKTKLDSDEFIKLKRLIAALEVDVEQLQQRFKRKIKTKAAPEEEEVSSSFNDGFDELRKLNKEQNP